MRKIRQRDETDCAAACLAAIANHYRLELSVSGIRLLAGTGAAGTTVLGVVHAAESLGFSAKGVKGAAEHLSDVPLPCIAHVVPNPGHLHFVVITKVTRSKVTVMDPAEGAIKRIPRRKFEEMWSGVLVLLAPAEGFKPGRRTERPFTRFWMLIRPHRTVLVAALVGAAVATILGLSTSVYVEKLVDNVIVEGNRKLLNLMGVAMLIILAFRILITWQQSLLAINTGQKIDAVLIMAYHRRLLRLPQRFFDTMRVGDIISRMDDALSIRAFLSETALELILNAFLVVFAFAALFFYSWQLAVFSLAIIPAILVFDDFQQSHQSEVSAKNDGEDCRSRKSSRGIAFEPALATRPAVAKYPHRQNQVCGLSAGDVRSEDFERPSRRISSSTGRGRRRR